MEEGNAFIQREETVDVVYERKRKAKGKAPMEEVEETQPLKNMKAREAAQIDHDAELARKLQEDERSVASFMETQRLQNIQMVNDPILDYQPSKEEIQYMINNDPEVKAKAIQLITDLL